VSRNLRRAAWAAVVLLCLLLAAVLVAPEIGASAWREPLELELGRAFGRPVQVRNLRYQLYPSPGLLATDLVIPEDPAFGLEPLAYVTELRVGLRLASLFLGRLEVDSVRMVDASVNVSRAADRGYNISQVLGAMAAAAHAGNPPVIELRACRINFRFGLVKSSYYLNNVDLDLQPPSESNRRMRWTFEASPARTDRAEQGFGRFTGEGAWSPSRGREGSVDAQVELETSAVSEVVTLLSGRDLGLQGRVSSRVRIDGPLESVRVAGQAEFMEVDHAGVFGLRGKQFQLPLEGRIDIPGQSFEISMAAREPAASPPIEIKLLSSNTLIEPLWKAEFIFRAFPAATAAELARRLGSGLPPGFEVAGEVDGSLVFDRGGAASGQVTVRSAVLRMPDASEISSKEAALTVAGGEIRFSPSEVEDKNGLDGVLSGEWNTITAERTLDLKLTSATVEGLNKPAKAVAVSLPFLDACQSGKVAGVLHYRSAGARPWTGSLNIAGLECAVDGMAAPLRSARSTLTLRDDGWVFHAPEAEVGVLTGSVDLTWKPSSRRPLGLQAAIAEADAAQIEDLLAPSLSRRRSLLDRTLSFGRSSVPGWLSARRLSGHIRIGKLQFAGVEAAPAEANIFWDGANMELSSITMRFDDASFSGRLLVALAGSAPSYRAAGRLDDYPHGPVTATVDMDLRTSGLGRALLENLQATGEVQILGASLDGAPVQPLRAVFDYSARRNLPRLRLNEVEAGIDGGILTGSGAVSPDARLNIDLSSPARAYRLAVTLSPWLIETRP